MPWRRMPLWVGLGGASLAFTAGYVNSVGFLSAQPHGLTHVTGQVTKVAIELAAAQPLDAARAALVIVWFFFGAALSGILIRSAELSRTGREYGVAMIVEAVLLLAAAWLIGARSSRGYDLLAFAAGLQNAMASSYSGAVIRTTHMTGLVTDLGILLGHAVRRAPVDWRKFGLLSLLFGGFLAGGIVGALLVPVLAHLVLVPPAVVLFAAALAFFVVSRRPGETGPH